MREHFLCVAFLILPWKWFFYTGGFFLTWFTKKLKSIELNQQPENILLAFLKKSYLITSPHPHWLCNLMCRFWNFCLEFFLLLLKLPFWFSDHSHSWWSSTASTRARKGILNFTVLLLHRLINLPFLNMECKRLPILIIQWKFRVIMNQINVLSTILCILIICTTPTCINL